MTDINLENFNAIMVALVKDYKLVITEKVKTGGSITSPLSITPLIRFIINLKDPNSNSKEIVIKRLID